MTIALITPPSIEPLTLQDVKNHLRIDHDHEDELLMDTLKAARQYVEFSSDQKCITQMWRQYENKIHTNYTVSLKINPIISVSSVVAFDADGNASTLAPESYDLLRGEDTPTLQLTDSLAPNLAANGFEIDVVAGFGDLGIDVPDTLKRAMLLLVAHWYEFRGAVSPQDQPVSLPAGFDVLLAQFKRIKL